MASRRSVKPIVFINRISKSSEQFNSKIAYIYHSFEAGDTKTEHQNNWEGVPSARLRGKNECKVKFALCPTLISQGRPGRIKNCDADAAIIKSSERIHKVSV